MAVAAVVDEIDNGSTLDGIVLDDAEAKGVEVIITSLLELGILAIVVIVEGMVVVAIYTGVVGVAIYVIVVCIVPDDDDDDDEVNGVVVVIPDVGTTSVEISIVVAAVADVIDAVDTDAADVVVDGLLDDVLELKL